MPEQKQNPIIRYETFTVKEAVPDQYGNLIVTTTDGVPHKIGVKRANLFPVFQVGAEVKVGYSEYMNKEYIATAEQTGIHKADNHLVDAAKKAGAVEVPQTTIAPQSIGMTTKEIGDMIRAKMLTIVFGEDTGKLTDWYRKQILKNTQV